MPTTRYSVFDGEIVSESRAGVLHDYVSDPLGNTVALLDNTQTQTDQWAYFPYGESVRIKGTTPTCQYKVVQLTTTKSLHYVGREGSFHCQIFSLSQTFVL